MRCLHLQKPDLVSIRSSK